MDINTLHSVACKGDKRAIDELFAVLTSRFRMFARHKIKNGQDAEEIVQEALVAISAEYNNITFTTSFNAWACKVLDNRMLDYFRKKKRENKRFDKSAIPDSDSMATEMRANPDLKRKLKECLHKICRKNIRYARILNLHFLGYKTDEICGNMDVKPATLYSALSKARSMLEICLEKGDIR